MTQQITLQFSRVETPIGTMLVGTDGGGYLRLLDWQSHEDRMHLLLGRYYGAAARIAEGAASATVLAKLHAFFAGDIGAIDGIPAAMAGTPFQREVWSALREIPAGETWSYGKLAEHIGRPSAVRAVGLANGANPIGVVVPCHRVIGANGALTGYGGGIERKQWLLQHEGAQLKLVA